MVYPKILASPEQQTSLLFNLPGLYLGFFLFGQHHHFLQSLLRFSRQTVR